MACLVIAASGATCPAEGCFERTPREQRWVDLPFYSSAGEQAGSFHICVYRHGDARPRGGQLSTRGWALQESYLARRILYFMPGGPTWSCHDDRLHDGDLLDERNIIDEQGQYSDWESVVERFSGMDLTHKSDRLLAVQGIGTELAKKMGDTYDRGVFLSQIADHLLWMSSDTAPDSEDLNDTPSWSWASKGGKKQFFGIIFKLVTTIDQGKVHIHEQGYLRLQGKVVDCKVFETPNKPRGSITSILAYALIGYTYRPVFDIGETAQKSNGIAVFDRQDFQYIHCLCLMSTTLETISDIAYKE